MLVRDVIPGATEAVIFPLQEAPQGVKVYNRLLDSVDAQGRCRNSALRKEVLDRIAAGDIIVLPPRVTFIISNRLEAIRLDRRQIMTPSVARTLGLKEFWPAVKELIVLLAPHATAWSNDQEVWLKGVINRHLVGWLPFIDRRIRGLE